MPDITIGDALDTEMLPENYQGPPDTVCVIASDSCPRDIMMFVKDRIVIAIFDRSIDDPDTMPKRGDYDAVFMNTKESPQAVMGKKSIEEAQTAYRKRLS